MKLLPKIHPSIPFTIAILILLYMALNAWIYFYGTKIFTFNPTLKQTAENVSIIKKQGFSTLETAKPKHTIPKALIYALPTGKQEWTFTHGSGVTGPKIETATVDTLTPTKGQTQTVTITAKHDSSIQATATLVTDNKREAAPMKLMAGTDTDGTWTTSWTITDSYDYMYHIDFVLTSASGNWTGALTFR